MKLKQTAYKLKIQLESGMHIGGGDSVIEIGGIDNTVIRDAMSGEPYIPGSSLKGKLRHLLLHYYRGQKEEDYVLKMFGVSADKDKEKHHITRLQFIDLALDENSREQLNRRLGPGVYTEIKYENTIDFKTGRTKHGGLRQMERVPRGAIFTGELILNTYELYHDQLEAFETVLHKGIELLNHSYLGGSGSRGYGKVHVSLEVVPT